MTRYLLDVASYQGALKPADVKRAGFSVVNLKISHGLGQTSVHPNITGWIRDARALGLGIGTFHWLLGSASGAAQAQYAYGRMQALGLLYGTAHTLDIEVSVSLAQITDYVTTMQTLLGRPVAIYSADWYWDVPTRGWNGAKLTPYLWSAPNAGYLAGYPGDTSSHWTAGWGGWAHLSIMQYAVQVLMFPDGSHGSIKVSKSAIRDDTVWRDLTQGRPGLTTAPASLLTARRFYIDTLAKAGFTINPLSVGIVGDDNHAKTGSSYHLGKSALRPDSYTIVESPRDRNGLSEAAAALDLGMFTITVGGKKHDLRSFSVWLVAQCKANTPDTADIREVIYSPDGSTVKRWDRLGKRSTGDNTHLSHTHESWFRDSETRDKTAHLKRYFTEIGVLEDDMPTLAEIETLIAKYVGDVVRRTDANGNWVPATDPNPKMMVSSAVEYAGRDLTLIKKALNILSGDQPEELSTAQAVKAVESKLDAVPDQTVERLKMTDASPQQKADLLKAVLGTDAAEVGRLLAGT